MYIGQSSDVLTRIKYHINKLNKKTHDNKYFENAWNKYGGDSFAIKIIKICETFELNYYEEFFIQYFNSFGDGYNLNKGGDYLFNQKLTFDERSKISSKALKGLKKSEEHKKNLSKNKKEFYKSNPHPRLGKKLNDEQKEIISKNHHCVSGENNPMFGKTHTQETKNKISKANKGNISSVGSKNGMAILNEESVLEIKSMLLLGVDTKILSQKYGVEPATIRAIKNNKIWKNVKLQS
jgi:group I intron endonuclease